MSEVKVTVLGSGGSMGTPVASCKCSVCTSKEKLNHRLRSSVLIEHQGKTFLIDATPDFRYQALSYHFNQIDATLITHHHEDHIGGLNDLRPYYLLNHKKRMPLILSESTLNVIKMRFGYLLERFTETILADERGSVVLEGVNIRYFSYEQRGVTVNGFRLGKFAYVTDIKKYPKTIFKDLSGVDVLMVSVIHELGTPMHFSLQEGIEFAKKAGVKKCYFTHIAHDMEHVSVSKKLPEGIFLAYDGLQLSL